jgi:anti-sigma-K factor RskA
MNAPLPPPDELDPVGPEPPDDETLAAELVLGVLSDPDRRAALERARTDVGFAVRVASWERRFAPWLAEVAPVTVPAEIWERICRGLGWREDRSLPLWSSLVFWRGVAAAALVTAVALWLTRPPAPVSPASTALVPGAAEPAARPVTTLTHSDGSPGWLATVDRAHGRVLMVPVPAPADPQGRIPELWIIPAGQAPRSLGGVSINKAHTVAVPEDSRTALGAPGSVLAITLEPAVGIPHAAPSGPVIASGAITG